MHTFTSTLTATKNTATGKWVAAARITQDGAEFTAPVHIMSGDGDTLEAALGSLLSSVQGFADGLQAAADLAGGFDRPVQGSRVGDGPLDALFTCAIRASCNVEADGRRARFYGEKARLCYVTLGRC